MKFRMDTKMGVVNVDGKPFLFSDIRIDRSTIPPDMVAYDVRDADEDGEFHQVLSSVVVDYWGTIIGPERIEDAENDGYACRENDGVFIEDSVTAEEFLEDLAELTENCRELKEEADEHRRKAAGMSEQELLSSLFKLSVLDERDSVMTSMIESMLYKSAENAEMCRRIEKTGRAGAEYVDYLLKLHNYLQAKEDEQGGCLDDDVTVEACFETLKQAEKDLETTFCSRKQQEGKNEL